MTSTSSDSQVSDSSSSSSNSSQLPKNKERELARFVWSHWLPILNGKLKELHLLNHFNNVEELYNYENTLNKATLIMKQYHFMWKQSYKFKYTVRDFILQTFIIRPCFRQKTLLVQICNLYTEPTYPRNTIKTYISDILTNMVDLDLINITVYDAGSNKSERKCGFYSAKWATTADIEKAIREYIQIPKGFVHLPDDKPKVKKISNTCQKCHTLFQTELLNIQDICPKCLNNK